MKKLTPLFILMILVFSGCSTESIEDQGQISNVDAKAKIQEAINPLGFYSGPNLKGTLSVTNDCDNLYIEIIPTGDDPEDAKLGVFADEALPETSGHSGNIKTDDFFNLPENSLTWSIPLHGETSFNIFIKAWSTWAGAESTEGINQNYIAYTVDYTGCEEVCTHGKGWWKNHSNNNPGNQEDMWPVQELQLGILLYSQEELNTILDASNNVGNGIIILAQHLIAAKLNLANGVDDSSISQSIEEADDLISDHTILDYTFTKQEKQQSGDLKDALEAFNESNPCQDEESETE